MPNRPTHTKITIALTASSLIPAIMIGADAAIPFLGGIASTLSVKLGKYWVALNPDLDIVQNNSDLAKMLGFSSYQQSISHRSGLTKSSWRYVAKNPLNLIWMSHLPVIGTLPRFLIVLILLGIVALMLGVELKAVWILWWFLGMAWSDLWHIIADISWSWIKSKWK